MTVESPDGIRKRGKAQEAAGAKVADAAASPLVAEEHKESNLQGEWLNLGVLLVLYFLQGLPMGLSAILPMILKERGASFSDVGTFSLNSWPFSLKLLWAPIVDTVYIATVGRRKTWMVPSQLLIGTILIAMSTFIDDWLYADKPAILPLTGIFFLLYFLCATQDIAVDGWALTMLRPENVSWAATCNAFGQTAGYAFGFVGYTTLESWKVVTLASFAFYSGIAFIVVTVLVGCLKREEPVSQEHEPEDLAASYRQMLRMFSLPPLRLLIVVLFTWKMAFPITDAIAPLKLQEYGVPKEHLTYMMSSLMPVYMLLPLIASKWTSGKRPLDLAARMLPLRVFLIPVTAAVVYYTPKVVDPLPYGFYSAVVAVSFAGSAASEFMFVSNMAFFARISDPAMGGTYMTLLNTFANLGTKWPSTLMFYLVDLFTCKEEGCSYKVDGFYVVAAFSTVVGVLWCFLGTSTLNLLQLQSLEDWRVRK